MDKLLRQLLALLEQGTTEQRCATLLVLGALKVDDSHVIKGVESALSEGNPVLKDYALRYFEAVEPKGAVPLLLGFLEDADKEIQERTIRLLGRSGQVAVPPLLLHVSAASRAGQLNAARALCAVRGKSALKGLLQMLRSGNDDFNKAVCDLLTPAIREMDSKEQELLYSEVEGLAASLDVQQHRPTVVAVMRLLGQLGRSQSRRWLFRFIGREHHGAVRAHALVALLRCLRDQELRRDEYAKLFPLLEEEEFSEVTRLALELLDVHGVPDDSRAVLARLMQSPHGTIQNFALRKLGDFNTPATVRTLVEQLGDPDYRKRDTAAQSLRKIPESRATLIKELLACNNPSKAWTIAELLSFYDAKWRQDILDALWQRLQAAVRAQDRIQSSFLHVLKSANAGYLYAQLTGSAAKLLKSENFKEAAAFLMPLKEFSEFRPEDKFHLALAQLKLRSHKVAGLRQDPALDQLSELYRNSSYPLLEALKKEKALSSEDLFYLGFTFVERGGEERALGRGLLEHLAVTRPRTKLGKNARNKLKLLRE
jgi:HEAT repeat protein